MFRDIVWKIWRMFLRRMFLRTFLRNILHFLDKLHCSRILNYIGRVYSLSTKKIFAYKYKDGNIIDENGNSLTPTEFEYEKYERLSHTKMKKGIQLTSIGGVLIAVGTSLIVYGVYQITVYAAKNPTYDANPMIIPMLVGGYMSAASIPFLITGPIIIKKAKRTHQKANELKAMMSLNPFLLPTLNSSYFKVGVGIGINF